MSSLPTLTQPGHDITFGHPERTSIGGRCYAWGPRPLKKSSHYTRKALLHGPISPEWQVVHPLLLSTEEDSDGTVLVSDDVFAMYGEGDSFNQALRDYVITLIEYEGLLARRTEAGDEGAGLLLRRLHEYLQSA